MVTARVYIEKSLLYGERKKQETSLYKEHFEIVRDLLGHSSDTKIKPRPKSQGVPAREV